MADAVYRFTQRGLFNSEISMENVHHFSCDPLPDSAALIAIATWIDENWETYLMPVITTVFQLLGWYLRRVDVADQPTYPLDFQGAGDGEGDAVGGALPPQTAMVVNMTGFSTYPRLCRTYLPGFVETNNEGGGVPDSTAIGAAEDFMNSILVPAIGMGYTVRKVSVRYTGDPPIVTAWNPVTAVNVSQRWGTLRSRRY
jgi:hypothetical protein